MLRLSLGRHKYTIAKLLIGAGLLLWLVWSGRLDLGLLFSARLSIFHLFGILVLLGSMLLQAARWWWLLRTQDIHLSFQRAAQLTWISYFFALVLPGLAGGELVRAYYIVKEAPRTKVSGASTVLLDRVLGLYAMLWLGLGALIMLMMVQNGLSPALLPMGTLILLLAIGTTVALLALWFEPTRNGALRLLPERFRGPVQAALDAYHAHGREVLGCFALSLLASMLLMSGFFLASRVVGTPLMWKQVFLVGPLVFVANTVPISPGGIGVGEAAASVLFARCNIETGAAIMLIVRLWQIILRLPGVLLYVLGRRGSQAAEARSTPEPDHEQEHYE